MKCSRAPSTKNLTRTNVRDSAESLTASGRALVQHFLHDAGELLQESLYSLDEQAVLIDMNRLDHDKAFGGYQEIRRVE